MRNRGQQALESIMSISAISTSPATTQSFGSQSNFGQYFGQLVNSLNSNNLAGAQQAYSSLSQLLGGSSANSSSPFSQALSQIGQALQDGDLSGAQQALSSLQQARGQHHHHHGHHGGANSESIPATTSPASTSSSASSNTVNITA